jgi:hypothetical protein
MPDVGMQPVRSGWESQAARRYSRLFASARRKFAHEVEAIFARHAADGLLKSGKTIKVVVRALDDATSTAIDDALAGIAAVTEHAGRRRKRLIELLSASLAEHHDLIEFAAGEAISQIGLGADFKQARPLIGIVKLGHGEKIKDFGEGWTAPVGKPWKDRHPILFAIIVALIGALIGIAGKALIDSRVLAEPRSPVHDVAPNVAAAPDRPSPGAANSN